MPKSKKPIRRAPMDIRLGVALAACIEMFSALNPALTVGEVKSALEIVSFGAGKKVFLKP